MWPVGEKGGVVPEERRRRKNDAPDKEEREEDTHPRGCTCCGRKTRNAQSQRWILPAKEERKGRKT